MTDFWRAYESVVAEDRQYCLVHLLRELDRRIKLIHRRRCDLADAEYAEADTRRLGARISRHRDHLFTFLDKPEVPFENNHAERSCWGD